MEVFNPNSNINFLGLRKISIALSAILVVLSIGAILVRGLNYGLDSPVACWWKCSTSSRSKSAKCATR